MAELYMVGGPIGNLGDMTARAVETLKAVDTVFAEDTRVTKVLLDRNGITKPLKSYREAAEAPQVQRSIDTVLSLLRDGRSVAYLSDAGTPGVSDPGSYLVAKVAEAGFRIIPIPGASALASILSVAGFPSLRPLFVGFLPKKKGHQTLMGKLRTALDEDLCDTIVLYESPQRILKLLEELRAWNMLLDIVVGRELTKMHEELVRGTTDEVYEKLKAKTVIKGEITVALRKQTV